MDGKFNSIENKLRYTPEMTQLFVRSQYNAYTPDGKEHHKLVLLDSQSSSAFIVLNR